MLNRPKTKEDAKKHRYGHWAGNPGGEPYDPNRCAEEVSSARGFGFVFYQCSRRNGHGPGGLYCKQHAKKFSEG